MKTETSEMTIANPLERRGQNIGPVTPEMIEQRSRQLAERAGHGSEKVTEADHLAALHELYDEEQSYALATPQVVYQTLGNPDAPRVIVHASGSSPHAE
jgi:hypothetical protein